MARVWRQDRPMRIHDDDYVEVVETDDTVDYGTSVAERIISTIGSIIIALLSLRFLLSLFGANRASGFASFIYGITEPLISPFRGMFGASPRLGEARLEFETVIAIVVYAVLTYVLARIVSIPRRRTEI